MKLLIIAALFTFGLSGCATPSSNSAATLEILKDQNNPDVLLYPQEYTVFSNIGKVGKPYFLKCNNGGIYCFNDQSICKNGNAVSADPAGKPMTGEDAKAPATMTYPGAGKVRIFMCVGNQQ